MDVAHVPVKVFLDRLAFRGPEHRVVEMGAVWWWQGLAQEGFWQPLCGPIGRLSDGCVSQFHYARHRAAQRLHPGFCAALTSNCTLITLFTGSWWNGRLLSSLTVPPSPQDTRQLGLVRTRLPAQYIYPLKHVDLQLCHLRLSIQSEAVLKLSSRQRDARWTRLRASRHPRQPSQDRCRVAVRLSKGAEVSEREGPAADLVAGASRDVG